MAKKKEVKKEKLERTYVINLRREFIKAPTYKKTGKAVRGLKAFVEKHMKSKDIKICKELNDLIWKDGKKNPPPRVEVKCLKEDDVVQVQLPDKEFMKAEEEKEVKKPKVAASKDDKKVKEKKEVLENPDKKETPKEEVKVEEKPKEEKKIVTESKKTSTK